MQKHDDIGDRLIDARILWQNDRKNGAFIQALIALAAVASLRYPEKTAPKVYFDKMRKYHPNQASQIAAAEKKHKHKKLIDRQQFKCMVLDLLEDIIGGMQPPKYNVSFPFSKDESTNIEDLFYHLLRCNAVHEGTFSSVAYLTEPTPEGDVLRLTEPAGIPERWIANLVDALAKTPELSILALRKGPLRGFAIERLITTIDAAMGMRESISNVIKLLVKVRDADLKAELQEALLDAQGEALDLQERVARLQEENVELRKRLGAKDEAERLEREVLYLAQGVWWRKDEQALQAYCPSCWACSQTLIPLTRHYRGTLRYGGECPTCKAPFPQAYAGDKPDAGDD